MAKFGSSFECLLGGGVYTGRLDGRHSSTAAQGGGGDSCDIGNYREITLGSHIGKVLCAVLNARLSEVMESKILGKAQGGFRRNRRTTDQVFVVSGIGQIRRSQGKKTWMAFLDFKKAFPSVWRKGLWEKMKEYGIDGKFLRQDPPLDLSFWSFLTFLHHGIEEVERHIL